METTISSDPISANDKEYDPLYNDKIHKQEAIIAERNRSYIIYCLLLVFLIVTLVFVISLMGGGYFTVLAYEKDIIKPLVDNRKYKAIRLKNQLEVLLISDPVTSISASGLSVSVGSFEDPIDSFGLAHFCEHMIFLGTEKYNASFFDNHLKTYLGSSNAYTANNYTVYYYELGVDGFEKSFEMFSSMFSSPLFDINYMNKEINAINSENEKNLNNDLWRQYQLIKTMSNSEYSFHKFSTGNNETLRMISPDSLNKRLIDFFNKNYITTNMRLVVLDKRSIEDLEQLTITHFSKLKTGTKIQQINSKIKPFLNTNLKKLIWFNKLSNTKTLDFIFVVSEIVSTAELKPLEFIAYLLNYKGKSSLIDYLMEKGYANKLETDTFISENEFTLFYISIELTQYGLENIGKVVESTYNYLNLLKKDITKKEIIFKDFIRTSEIKTKFNQKPKDIGMYISQLIKNMYIYKYNDIIISGDLRRPNINSENSLKIIKSYIDQMNINNLLMMAGTDNINDIKTLSNNFDFVSSNSNNNKKEQWYKTNYSENEISSNYKDSLESLYENNNNFLFRDVNEYLTNQLEITSCIKNSNGDCIRNNDPPIIILSKPWLQIWYKDDTSFLTPKVNINMNIITNRLRTNVTDFLSIKFFDMYIKQQINIKLNDAIEAGNDIDNNINLIENGLSYYISSYADVSEKIMINLLYIIIREEVTEKSFNQVLAVTKENLVQDKYEQPYKKADFLMRESVKNNLFSSESLIKALETYAYVDFVSALKKLRNSMLIRMQLYGFLTNKQLDALKIEISQIPLNPDLTLPYDSAELIADLQFNRLLSTSGVINVKNNLSTEVNNVVVNYYQTGELDIKNYIIMSLIEIAWGNTFFYELRTIKQLGYIVAAGKALVDTTMYFKIIVQGSKELPDKINEEIKQSVLSVEKMINKLTLIEFNVIKSNYKQKLLKRDTNLKESSDYIWNEIFLNTKVFNRKELLIKELENVSLEDVKGSYKTMFLDDRKLLSVHVSF